MSESHCPVVKMVGVQVKLLLLLYLPVAYPYPPLSFPFNLEEPLACLSPV